MEGSHPSQHPSSGNHLYAHRLRLPDHALAQGFQAHPRQPELRLFDFRDFVDVLKRHLPDDFVARLLAAAQSALSLVDAGGLQK